ncbi:MAG TPA: hypothetical protein VMF69_26295 [Gemmataceae bacterium]|nr:hypothetical protein [Gemmataceae bacterium]
MSVPAGDNAQFVVQQIRGIGKDATLRDETFAAACAEGQASIDESMTEHRGLERNIERWLMTCQPA